MNDLIAALLEAINERTPQSLERLTLLRSLLTRVVELGEFEADTSELTVAATALDELLDASNMFHAFRDRQKLAVFGSARTPPESPLYALAESLSKEMAGRGWMVISGAGGGIMEAAAKGAGREFSLGVNIDLPFEQFPNPYIDASTKLVEMKYFFTRKAALTRPSNAFVVLPGGFGTLDEAFEILTLLHTGKAEPAPMILLDSPEGRFWSTWREFVEKEIVDSEYIKVGDLDLVSFATSVDEAVAEIEGFYANYQDCTIAEGVAALRLKKGPDADQMKDLAQLLPEFAADGGFSWSPPYLRFGFNGRNYVALRRAINAANSWA